MKEVLTMTKQELDRYRVLNQVSFHHLTQGGGLGYLGLQIGKSGIY